MEFTGDLVQPSTDGRITNPFGHPIRVVGQFEQIDVTMIVGLHGTPLRSEIIYVRCGNLTLIQIYSLIDPVSGTYRVPGPAGAAVQCL